MSVLMILCWARCVSNCHCMCDSRKVLSARNSMMYIWMSLLIVVGYVFWNFHVMKCGMMIGRYR